MEEKQIALVLKSVDYQENDKMLWLYTLEQGKIVATIKGVKKATAKLKYAAEPFCFGEFSFSLTHGRYTVIGCALTDSFYSIREDLDKYYCGCAVFDVLASLENEGESKPHLFIDTLKALEKIAYTDISPKLVAVKFLLSYLKSEGFALSFDNCNSCRTSASRLWLDLQVGGVLCAGCKSQNSIALEGALLTSLRFISNTEYEQLHTIKLKDDYINDCLSVLNKYYTNVVGNVKGLNALTSL